MRNTFITGKIKAAFFAAALIALFALTILPAFADGLVLLDGTDAAEPVSVAPSDEEALVDPDLPRVIDEAGLLTADEAASLEQRISAVTAEYHMDVVILTVNGTDGADIVDFADDFYDYSGNGGYGWGENRDGVLLCVDMTGREMWISTCGRGIDVFTDYGIDLLLDGLVERFGDEDYCGAFSSFVDDCESFIGQADAGEPVDTWIPDDPYEGSSSSVSRSERKFSIVPYAIALVVGIVAALIVTGSMKAKLHTAVPQSRADSYVKRDSFDLMSSEDTFLYSHVASSPRSTDSGRSGGGGHYGGSSTHTSSSGTSHGGGGRSF